MGRGCEGGRTMFAPTGMVIADRNIFCPLFFKKYINSLAMTAHFAV